MANLLLRWSSAGESGLKRWWSCHMTKTVDAIKALHERNKHHTLKRAFKRQSSSLCFCSHYFAEQHCRLYACNKRHVSGGT